MKLQMMSDSMVDFLARLMHQRVNESVLKGLEALQRNGELILIPGDLTLVQNLKGDLDVVTEIRVELRDREIISSLQEAIKRLKEENQALKKIMASHEQN